MFDILAASYMSASRMDHFLEQDIMHRNPEIARRLRERNWLHEPIARANRRRRPILRPAIRWFATLALAGARLTGTGLRRAGAALETAASRSYQREVFPEGFGNGSLCRS